MQLDVNMGKPMLDNVNVSKLHAKPSETQLLSLH